MIEVAVPAGSRFKGYQDVVVQELRVSRAVVLCRRRRWQLADGGMVVAPQPSGIEGHYGPELRRFVLAQYHQGQTRVESGCSFCCRSWGSRSPTEAEAFDRQSAPMHSIA